LSNPELQAAFHDACRDEGLIGSPVDWNRELLRLRKTGDFPKRGAIQKVQVADDELDLYNFAAEIAWRAASDKFAGASLDEIYCDPAKAAVFDRTAKRFAPGFEPAQYRWAALRLRKASRELVGEVKRYHFVFAKRDFSRFQTWRRFDTSRYNGEPGIYLLRGDAKEPLYVGGTFDLGRRLAQHAECAVVNEPVDRISVLTGDELPAVDYRGAFKEDLVRRYQPAWNVNLVGLQRAEIPATT
jgi:site-specific DNA-methyltransferase (adenine-specific)